MKKIIHTPPHHCRILQGISDLKYIVTIMNISTGYDTLNNIPSNSQERTNLEYALVTWNQPLVNNFENQWNGTYTQYWKPICWCYKYVFATLS